MERYVKMFHRVRSEVQESEQKNLQSPQAAEKDYKSREVRGTVNLKRRDDSSDLEIQQEQELEMDSQPELELAEAEAAEQRKASPFRASPQSYVNEVEVQTRTVEVSTNAFQRPFQPAGRSPGAYPGSYPGAYVPPQVSAHEIPSYGASAADRTLTIGRGINMSGEIEACDHLVVEGTVEAALKGAKVLEVAESGTFYGTVEIEEATIAGRFEGDITVNGRLTIRSTGAITGSIAYKELEVESGALLDGKMTPLKTAPDPRRTEKYKAGSDASAMAKAREVVAKREGREPANSEAIFSKANTKA